MSDDTAALCREHGIAVIPVGCPNLFGATSDVGHRFMRVVLSLTSQALRSLEEPGR